MANLQVGVAGNGTVTVGAGASVHSPASNTLTLGTNGDERVRIDSNGMSKFTRGSTGTVAHFYANARESNILIQNDAKTWKIVNYDYGNNGTDHLGFHDGSSDRLVIGSNGCIGIGPTNPSQYLHVESSSNTTARVSAHGFMCRDNWGTHTSIGNGMFSPATNSLAFATNSTERLRIDSSGHVGIGTDVPSQGGHTKSLTVSSLASAARSALNIQGNTANCHACVEMRNNGTLVSGLYSRGTDRLQFGTGSSGTVRGQFTSDGLNFGSDTAAANALDDYEEGTFTPVLGGGSPTYSTNNTTGYYVKVGRMVHISVQIAVVVTGAGSGSFTISGLPFTSGTVSGGHGQALSAGPLYAWDFPTNMVQIGPRVNDNTTTIYIWANFDDAADAYLTWPFGSSGTHYGSLAGTYVSAS